MDVGPWDAMPHADSDIWRGMLHSLDLELRFMGNNVCEEEVLDRAWWVAMG